MLAVVCKLMQQLPTMLETTHKTLEITFNASTWPKQYWKSCVNGSNIVALRFGDNGAK